MRVRPFPACALALAITILPIPAEAQDTFPADLAAREGAILLGPQTPWNIDFGENRCRLTRAFGSAEDRYLLMLEQAAPGRYFGLTIAGREIERFKTAAKIDLGLERDEPVFEVDRFGQGSVADFGPALIFSSIALDEAPQEGAQRAARVDPIEADTIDRIVLRRNKLVLSLETGNMGEAVAALNTCSADLLAAWGLNLEEHQSYVPPVWSNEDAVASRIKSVYPRSALRSEEQAIFRIRVIVERDGTVSDCLMDASTVVEKLESPACKEMLRATFEPARNAKGEPMRSFYATTITYSLG